MELAGDARCYLSDKKMQLVTVGDYVICQGCQGRYKMYRNSERSVQLYTTKGAVSFGICKECMEYRIPPLIVGKNKRAFKEDKGKAKESYERDIGFQKKAIKKRKKKESKEV